MATKKKRTAKKTVKLLGYTVTVGTKRHSILLQQKRHFDDLAHSEQGDGKRKNTGKRKAKPAAKRKPAAKKRSRRNTGVEDRAAEVYKEFHGRGPGGVVIDVETPIVQHNTLVGIGKLVRLVIETTEGPRTLVTLEFKGTMLAMNTKKTQLYIEGGNQSVNLADFNIKPPIHETEVLGLLRRVFYDTVKTHLGDTGGDAIYNHEFSRNAPAVIYDTRNKLLTLAGGRYDMPPEGIRK